ncbi:MAG: DUF4126 family protein [Burkholderiales bacterium]
MTDQTVNLPLLACVLALGFIAGLRSMIAPAVIAWAAHLNWLCLQGTPLSFMAGNVAIGIFSVGAIGELVADKLPTTPRRTAIAPLIWRMITGGLSGACLAVALHHSLGTNAVLGAIGAVLGAFVGYETRRRLATKFPDFAIALTEDLIAIGLAIFLVSRWTASC